MSFKRSVAAVTTASMITIGLATPSAQAQIVIPADIQKQLNDAGTMAMGSLLAPLFAPAAVMGSMNPVPQDPNVPPNPAMSGYSIIGLMISFGIGAAFYAAIFGALDSLLSS